MKLLKATILLISVFIYGAHCWRSFILSYSGVSCKQRSNLISYINCSIRRINRNQYSYNLNIKLAQEVKRPHISYLLMFARPNKPDYVVINVSRLDGCQYLNRKIPLNVLSILRDELDKFGTLPSCPVPKGFAINLKDYKFGSYLFPFNMPETKFVSHVVIENYNMPLLELFINGSSKDKKAKNRPKNKTYRKYRNGLSAPPACSE